MSRKGKVVLCVTANPDVTGARWHAARDPAEGYAWTLCGWLVQAHNLGRHRSGRVECKTCSAKLEDRS